MAYCVHVCKKYEIEYGDATGFNHETDKFYDLLNLLGGEPSSSDGDGNPYDSDFECSVEDYDDAIENMKMYIANPDIFFKEQEGDDNEDGERIEAIITELNMTREEVLDVMQRYRKEEDVLDGYIHFSCF